MPDGYPSYDELIDAERASREDDARRLAAGEVGIAELREENGFFRSLDRDRAHVSRRRVRISLA